MEQSALIKDRDIIYLAANDYNTDESKTSTDHVAEQFAKHNRVLFVESVGMRAPRATGRDLRRVLAKVKSFFHRPRKIHDRLWVYTPIALPLHRYGLVRAVNRLLLRLSIRMAARSAGFRDPILVVFLPQMGSVVGHLGETVSVYYCVDEYSAFPGVEPESVKRMERTLLESVDMAVATSQKLVDAKIRNNSHTYLMRHGVAFDHFAQVLDEDFPVKPQVAELPKPVIGFFGYIDDRCWDFELIRQVALSHPDWSVVLLGKSITDTSVIDRVPNVHRLRQCPFSEVPQYGKGFDVCILPLIINESTLHSNPIKLYEYLAMGKPVVSTPVEEVTRLAAPDIIEVAEDGDEFVRKIESCLENDRPEFIPRRQALAREAGSWEARMEVLGARIREAEERKAGEASGGRR